MTDDAPEYNRILAVDTATRVQAVGLVEGTELLEQRVSRIPYDHGSSLLRNIDGLIEDRAFGLDGIDLFAVGLGPGSFTGLRVGLADAKALSRAVESPVVGVSTLAALAYVPARLRPDATILSAIDARRREVYAGAYRFKNGQLTERLGDRAAAPDDWIATVEDELSGPLLQVGNAPENYTVLDEWDLDDLETVPTDLITHSPVAIARLGRRRAHREGPADRVNLQPNYIRPSDAVLPDQQIREMPEEPS